MIGLVGLLATSSVLAMADQHDAVKAYNAWCRSVAKARGDAHVMARFYAPDALLLPTFSMDLLVNRNRGLNDYFANLTQKHNLRCVTNQLTSRLYGDTAVNTGFYTFMYQDQGKEVKIPARFTFVYRKIGEDWLIVAHHSSVVPNQKTE
jgi:uncharacterized protein (TIGR02246 family)